MYFYKEVERYSEPIEILNKVPNQDVKFTLMNDNDLSFLCGIIKKFRPKKILEIGIAYGGTTAVIVNCLSKLDYECEMHSIDILESFRGHIPGDYLYEVKPFIKMDKIKHNFHLGNPIPCFIDDIGDDIDFVILDTAHGLPGELLDFITCFPYLSDNAVVVLHDIVDHCIWHENVGIEYATQLLFDTVVADKYMNVDTARVAGYPNIGAFQINKDTGKYIGNCFGAMNMTWLYMPDEIQYQQYMKCIEQNYSNEYLDILKTAKVLNQCSFDRNKNKRQKMLQTILGDKVYIYGAGVWGSTCRRELQQFGKEAKGYVISNDQPKEKKEKDGINIYYLNEVKNQDAYFILAVSDELLGIINMNIMDNGIQKYMSYEELHMLMYGGN